MFNWFKKPQHSGAANLAALFNNAGSSGGIENFATMLNNMGEGGGTKLGMMFNHLDSQGTSNYSAFLNTASHDESTAFSNWIERATESEIVGLCSVLNRTSSHDSAQLKNTIVSYANLRMAHHADPTYNDLKQAIVANDFAAAMRCINDRFDLNSRNEHGEINLLHSVCLGDARLEITRLLVESGADVNLLVNGKSLLEIIRNSAYCDNEDTIAYLVEQRCRDQRDSVAMPIDDSHLLRFQCPQCSKRLKADRRSIGRKATCNHCGCKLTVPEESQPAAIVQDAPPVCAPAERWSSPPPLPATGREAAKRMNDMANTTDTCEAERCLKAAIAADPLWAIPHCNLGRLLYEQGAVDEARHAFLRAYQLSSTRINPGDDLVCQQSEMFLRMLGVR